MPNNPNVENPTVEDPNLSAAPPEGGEESPQKTETPEAPAKVTPEAVDFTSRYLGKTATKGKSQKPTDEREEPKSKKPAKKKSERTPPPAPTPAAIDEEKLGRAVGESVAKAMKSSEKKTEPEPPKEDPAEARKLKVLRHMEKKWPDQYKGAASKYESSMQELRAYAEKWEKENPEKEFDQDDDEHQTFIAELEERFAYDNDDYVEALAELIAMDKVPKEDPAKIEELNNRLSEFERKEKVREAAPMIQKAGADAGNNYWKMLHELTGDDALASVVNEQGQINGEALSTIAQSDPVKYSIMVGAAQAAEAYSANLYMLENGLAPFDPDHRAEHKWLSDFAFKSEREFMAQDPEKQLNFEGKPFVPRDKFTQLSPAEREKVWTFSAEDLSYRIAEFFTNDAARRIEHSEKSFQAQAKARGLIREPEPELKPSGMHPISMKPKTSTPVDRTPEPPSNKPVSPTVPSVPRMAPPSARPSNVSKNPLASFAQRAIRGK